MGCCFTKNDLGPLDKDPFLRRPIAREKKLQTMSSEIAYLQDWRKKGETAKKLVEYRSCYQLRRATSNLTYSKIIPLKEKSHLSQSVQDVEQETTLSTSFKDIYFHPPRVRYDKEGATLADIIVERFERTNTNGKHRKLSESFRQTSGQSSLMNQKAGLAKVPHLDDVLLSRNQSSTTNSTLMKHTREGLPEVDSKWDSKNCKQLQPTILQNIDSENIFMRALKDECLDSEVPDYTKDEELSASFNDPQDPPQFFTEEEILRKGSEETPLATYKFAKLIEQITSQFEAEDRPQRSSSQNTRKRKMRKFKSSLNANTNKDNDITFEPGDVTSYNGISQENVSFAPKFLKEGGNESLIHSNLDFSIDNKDDSE